MAGARLAALAVVLLAAAACQRAPAPAAGGGPFAGVTLTFSASLAEEEQDAVRALLRRFEGEAGAAVKLVSVASDDLPDKLRVDVGAGRPSIDLFAQDNLALRVLVDRGLVEDLSDVALPAAVRPGMVPPRFDGRQYFLPFRPNVQVTYVNAARFRQAGVTPPTTAEELVAVARRLRAAAGGEPKVTLALAEGGAAAVTVTELLVGFGGNPLLLDDAGSVAAFEFLGRLWREGLLARESLLAKYDSQVDYLQGETAWLAANWPFTSMVFAEQDLLDRFRVYPGWQGPARAAHVIGGDVLGVPRGVSGRRREAALALARFLLSREAQATLVERNAWPAIRADAYGAVPPALAETFQAIEAALADGFYRPTIPYWGAVSDALNEGVRRIVVGGAPVRPTLAMLGARVAEAARRAGAPYPPPSARAPALPLGLDLRGGSEHRPE
jgi:trehalose transport system substrate-binding protein